MSDDDFEGRVFSEIGPWGLVPAWILDTTIYMPGVPDPAALKKGDEKPLTGGELRVYIAIRTFSSQSGYLKAFVKTLADRACVTKSTAEKAIGKFKRLGWLRTRRVYRPDGSIHRCDYFVKDVCPRPNDQVLPPEKSSHEGGTRQMEGTYPPDGGEGTRELEGAKNTPDEHTNRTHQRTEPISPASGHFAPSSGDRPEDDFDDVWDAPASTPTSTAEELSRRRADDRALFLNLVGAGRLRSDGSVFNEGVWATHLFYDAFRKLKRQKKSAFPGPTSLACAGTATIVGLRIGC